MRVGTPSTRVTGRVTETGSGSVEFVNDCQVKFMTVKHFTFPGRGGAVFEGSVCCTLPEDFLWAGICAVNDCLAIINLIYQSD